MGFNHTLRRVGTQPRVQSEAQARFAYEVGLEMEGLTFANKRAKRVHYERLRLEHIVRLVAIQRLECRRAGMQRCACNVFYTSAARRRKKTEGSCEWCKGNGPVLPWCSNGQRQATLRTRSHRAQENAIAQRVSVRILMRNFYFFQKLLALQQEHCVRAGLRYCPCLRLCTRSRWHVCAQCKLEKWEARNGSTQESN